MNKIPDEAIVRAMASTYNYYNRAETSEKKRCIVGHDGTLSPFGHYLVDLEGFKKNWMHIMNEADPSQIHGFMNDTLEPMLRDNVTHCPKFWDGMKRLHDDPMCWTKEGLSERGKVVIKHLFDIEI